MKVLLYVGCGGAIGAICRYGLSNIESRSVFPYITFIINISGAFLIGMVVAYATRYHLSNEMTLLLKTGICGGYTTFSTFSLEALTLLEQHKYVSGLSYICLSVILCILGVYLGMRLIESI